MNNNSNLFYTDSGLVIDRKLYENNKESFISSGHFGSAYKYDEDKVIKFLNENGDKEQYEVVSLIKNLSLSNFYKIYEVLSCSCKNIKTFGGTISQYCSSEEIDIFLQPCDYLLESFNSLCDSMIKLGRNNIFVYDLHKGNIILNKEGIFVIDVDSYQKIENSLPRKITIRNLLKLKSSIFNELLQSNFFQYHLDEIKNFKDGHFSKTIYELLNLDNFEDSQQFNRCLSKYKYPIDYIRSKK